MNVNLHIKKLISGALLVALVAISSPLAVPPKAHAAAGLDTADYLSIPIKTFTQAAEKMARTGTSVFGVPIPFTSLDSIMKLAVKAIIDQLMKRVMSWVGEGDNGEPLMVTDLGKFLNEEREKVGKRYLGEIAKSTDKACSFFKNDLVEGLSNQFDLPFSSGDSSDSSNCPLEEEVDKETLDAFFSGSFDEGGGWKTWTLLTQNDESNQMGAYLKQREILEAKMNAQETLSREEVNTSGGYKNARNSEGKVTTPGSVVSEQVNQVLSSNLRQLELAKTFDDIVTVLAQSLIMKMVNSGEGLLSDFEKDAEETAEGMAEGKYLKPKYDTTSNTSSNDDEVSQSQNSAVSGKASQSSTFSNDDYTHSSDIALTGSRNRNPKYGGVSMTKEEDNPWWQVDLGKVKPIDRVEITPRVDDGYGYTLTGFYVIISENPIEGNAIPRSGSGVWVSEKISPERPREDVTTVTPPSGTNGRYVRIQLDRRARLEVAGVEVFTKNVPVLTLIGQNPMTVRKGSTFTDPGAVAMDQGEGDISSKITTSGRVNTAATGRYTITYSVKNSKGVSSGSVTRTVIVE